jgi:hypothetical protein
MVRIAGLEPAHLAALPPQSSVSANSTICATVHNKASGGGFRKVILDFPAAISFLISEKSLPAAPVVGLRGIEFFRARFLQVPLQQQPDVLRAAPAVADGVDAVGVGGHDFQTVIGRAEQNAAAHAVEPVAGL